MKRGIDTEPWNRKRSDDTEIKEIGDDNELRDVDPDALIKQLKISYDELDSDEGEEEESEDEEMMFNDIWANRLDSIIEEDDEDATEYQRSRSRGKSRGSSGSRDIAIPRGSINKKSALYAPTGITRTSKPKKLRDFNDPDYDTLSLSKINSDAESEKKFEPSHKLRNIMDDTAGIMSEDFRENRMD